MYQEEQLNPTGCTVKTTKAKGRGIYASQFIPRGTLIEASPVLFFSQQEYELHGKHTVLDHYAFKWTDGRMALALGLGSLLNHSNHPNVSYTLDTKTDSIRYTTVRDISPDEELCIFYGHDIWFTPAPGEDEGIDMPLVTEHDDVDGWGGLSTLDNLGDVDVYEVKGGTEKAEITNPYAQGDPDEVIPEEDLPFTQFKLPPEEEDTDSICTIPAWVVDIPDPKDIGALLKWLKQSNLDTPLFSHLRRIRKQDNLTSLLLSPADTNAEPLSLPASALPPANQPILPTSIPLPPPYILPVPASSALTLASLSLKSALWPTLYTPRRKAEMEPWTRGKLRWAWGAMWTVIMAAKVKGEDVDDLPIAAYIPPSYNLNHSNGSQENSISFTARDTRKSSKHPLRHATLNVIRALADHRASSSSSLAQSLPPSADTAPLLRNGTNYLLTDRTVFITHEPCIMCSMALLHSRVKEVVYLCPSPKTGGCGGSVCIPSLKGVNHRFGILRWKEDSSLGWKGETVDCTIDV